MSLNSGVSRTPAGSSLSACEASPWNELTMAVCILSFSFTAFVPVQRWPLTSSNSARERDAERRLIASVTPKLTPTVPWGSWAAIEAMFVLSRLRRCLALMFAVSCPACQLP